MCCEGQMRRSYFIEEQFSPLLLPEVHHLDGDLPPAVLLSGDAHHTRGALADLHEVLQIRARVAGVHHLLQRGSELLVGESGHLGAAAGRLGRSEAGRRGSAGGRGRAGRSGSGLRRAVLRQRSLRGLVSGGTPCVWMADCSVAWFRTAGAVGFGKSWETR